MPHRSLNYFFYVAFAVTMASTAAYLVLVFAPTAAGSGIAEVKVILGGFGIRNFLSGWTLLIKARKSLAFPPMCHNIFPRASAWCWLRDRDCRWARKALSCTSPAASQTCARRGFPSACLLPSVTTDFAF
jgi:hypothetical protein